MPVDKHHIGDLWAVERLIKVEPRSAGVYEIASHIVWCLKYRRNLSKAVQTPLGIAITSIAEARGLAVREFQVMADHVHLFVSAPPTESSVGIVEALKAIPAKLLFGGHPVLRTAFRMGHLWSPSYYVGTVGHVSQETVLKYVRAQKARTVGRPKRSNSSSQ